MSGRGGPSGGDGAWLGATIRAGDARRRNVGPLDERRKGRGACGGAGAARRGEVEARRNGILV